MNRRSLAKISSFFFQLSFFLISQVYGSCDKATADLLTPERQQSFFHALDTALGSNLEGPGLLLSRYYSGKIRVTYSAHVKVSQGQLILTDLRVFAYDTGGHTVELSSELKQFLELKTNLIKYAKEKHLTGVVVDTYRCSTSTSCNKEKNIHIELKVTR